MRSLYPFLVVVAVTGCWGQAKAGTDGQQGPAGEAGPPGPPGPSGPQGAPAPVLHVVDGSGACIGTLLGFASGPVEAVVQDAAGLLWTARLATGDVLPVDATASELVWFAAADCTGTPLLPRWSAQVPFTVGPPAPGATVWVADGAAAAATVGSVMGPFQGCVAFSASGTAVAARQAGVVAPPRPGPIRIQ